MAGDDDGLTRPGDLIDLTPAATSAAARATASAAASAAPIDPAQHLGSLQSHQAWQIAAPDATARRKTFSRWLADDFAELRADGFVIEFERGWGDRIRQVDEVQVQLGDPGQGGADDLAQVNDGGWLGLTMGFQLDGRRFNLLPWLPQLVAQMDQLDGPADAYTVEAAGQRSRLWLHDEAGQWWGLPAAMLKPWLTALVELVGERKSSDFQTTTLELTRIDALRLAADTGQAGAPGGIKALRDVITARDVAGDDLPAPPPNLNATLRPYQLQGLAWLQALARQHLGGVLADDMGLGKTLQTLAHLLVEKQRGALINPALIVAPTSLVGNWRRECERFTPDLRLLVLHGGERHMRFDDIVDHDIVLTTYPLLPRDGEMLVKQPWHVVVLDEAQTIKNARTQAAQVVQLLRAGHRICLSGTPMENHLGEVWSLFHFLLPGYLSSENRFRSLFRNPIERQRDGERLTLLRRRLAPFMLRRSKDMVAAELPPKVETVVRVQMDPPQANLYETIRISTEASVRLALAEKGLARSHITVLDALLKLRQVCCDPQLLQLEQARKVQASAKLDWLMETLPEMIEEGRKVLLFSQFTSMLARIEERLAGTGLTWTKLTGQSKQRDELVEKFTSGQVPLFLISLKAGGVGLNLPQADTVIHYDPWWNPAVENQATDRAHRIGQNQTVFVYKLVAEGTLEERILALQERKAELARGLHGTSAMGAAAAASATGEPISASELDWLLQPLGAGLDSPRR
ncbi:MAG: DEAD/DEAH box helicase [Burkholderiales bacterium]|nr:DEAD/DEAH box helicase [Burkholderiales bacterium]